MLLYMVCQKVEEEKKPLHYDFTNGKCQNVKSKQEEFEHSKRPTAKSKRWEKKQKKMSRPCRLLGFTKIG